MKSLKIRTFHHIQHAWEQRAPKMEKLRATLSNTWNVQMRPLRRCRHILKKNNNIIRILLIKKVNVLTDSRRIMLLFTRIKNFIFHTIRGYVTSRDAISSSRWVVLPRAKIKCGFVLFSSIINLCTLIKITVNCRYSYLM
jgi:putative cell wall-binding protein